MSTERISNRQLLLSLFMMRVTVVISVLPVVTTADALQDAWIAAVLQFFPVGLFIFLVGYLGRQFPQKTIVQYGLDLLGKYMGSLVVLLVVFSFIHVGGTDARLYGELISVGLLPDTPLEFVTASLILTASLAAYAGIEVIGRLADLFLPFFGVMLLAIMLFPITELQFDNLQPVLSRGIGPAVRGSLTPIAMGLPFLVIGMLTPLTTQPKRALNSALLASLLYTVVLVIMSLITITALGPDPARRSFFPIYNLIRNIQVGHLLERMEVIVVFAWGFGLFVNLSVMVFCTAYALQQLFGMRSYRPLVGPLAVIISVYSIQGYRDIFELGQFFNPAMVGPQNLVIVGTILGLLWLGYGVRKLMKLGDNQKV